MALGYVQPPDLFTSDHKQIQQNPRRLDSPLYRPSGAHSTPLPPPMPPYAPLTRSERTVTTQTGRLIKEEKNASAPAQSGVQFGDDHQVRHSAPNFVVDRGADAA